MGTFNVTVYPIRLEDHPNADRLQMAVVGEYRAIVAKDSYQEGDLIAYIPEGAVVPQPILVEMGLEGRLAGSEKNRVKAVRLRGELSQGLCYPARVGWSVGQDVQDELGITKYVPPIPIHLAGTLTNAGTENTLSYDIENWKKFPHILQEGEPVVFTEKIHGTFTGIGFLPTPIEDHGDVVVFSKNMGQQGLVFKMDSSNDRNVYVRLARHLWWVRERLQGNPQFPAGEPVYLLGEIFGVQDLKYGTSGQKDGSTGYRIFDIYVGAPRMGRFLNDAELDTACKEFGIPRVPVLWRGPFTREAMHEWTTGRETVSGQSLHIREGIVIRPQVERKDFSLPVGGRVQLKSVSADYLLRKGTRGEEPTELE